MSGKGWVGKDRARLLLSRSPHCGCAPLAHASSAAPCDDVFGVKHGTLRGLDWEPLDHACLCLWRRDFARALASSCAERPCLHLRVAWWFLKGTYDGLSRASMLAFV
eukprot:361612-Chlamydomonas_euryale.AAC.8